MEEKQSGQTAQSSQSGRLNAIDITRGLIMVLMALDHCRDAVSFETEGVPAEVYHSFPYKLSNWLYLTRYATHLAAPGFFFLMGIGIIFLFESRKKKEWSNFKIIRHLSLRGAILILLEFTFVFNLIYNQLSPVVKLSWMLIISKDQIFEYWSWDITQQVLFVLGFAMIISAFILPIYYFFTNGKGSLYSIFKKSKPADQNDLTYLDQIRTKESEHVFGDELLSLTTKPSTAHEGIECGVYHLLGPISFFIIAIVLILLDGIVIWTIPEEGNSFADNLIAGFFFFPVFNPGDHYFIYYPTLNWIAVAILGIIFGHSIISPAQRTKSMVSLLCISLFSIFILFPAFQLAGAITTLYLPDNHYWKDGIQSFFYVIKYPPSFCFLSITLGILGICLSIFYLTKIHRFYILWPLEIFGKASLFFYVIHLWWFALIGLFINNLDLAGCYVIWFISLFPLFIFCYLFGKFKHSTPPDSLWRLF